jgi:hypothetical protein
MRSVVDPGTAPARPAFRGIRHGTAAPQGVVRLHLRGEAEESGYRAQAASECRPAGADGAGQGIERDIVHWVSLRSVVPGSDGGIARFQRDDNDFGATV